MTAGLVIGKFYPPHLGHAHLIRFARARVDRLIVIVFSRRDETIPGELRATWLAQIHPDCEIIHRVAEFREPRDANDFEARDFWVAATQHACLTPLDFVFTSEDYGDWFAARLGARHILVDRERRAVPISASQIRANPDAWREYLAPCVRAYFDARELIVVWRVTDFCNLSCHFCGHSRTLARPRRTADPAQMIAFGNVLRAQARVVRVCWLGGEPLVWQPLAALTREFKHQLGLRVAVTTNGTALASRAVREHIVADYDQIIVSIDGRASFHDQVRAAPGLFAQLERDVRALRELKMQRAARLTIGVNTILMRDNVREFEALCNELAEWGVEELTFNALGGRDRPEFFPAHRLTPENVAWFRDDLPRVRAAMHARGLHIRGNANYLARLDARARDEPVSVADCAPGTRFLFVDERGIVAPCHFTTNEFGVPLAQIGDAGAFQNLAQNFSARQRESLSAPCANCTSTQVFGKFADESFLPRKDTKNTKEK